MECSCEVVLCQPTFLQSSLSLNFFGVRGIVCYTTYWDAVASKVGYGGHNDGGGLSVYQLVQFIEITVMVYGDQVLLLLELKYILRDELPRSCRDRMGQYRLSDGLLFIPGHDWQYASMSLDMLGQKIASGAKRRQCSPPWHWWILLSILGLREVGRRREQN